MQLQEVIGRKRLISQWIHAYAGNRLHPVQLFQAQEGTGDVHLVLRLAKYLMCEQNQSVLADVDLFASTGAEIAVREDSCGVCNSCRKVDQMAHPDVHFFYPVINQAKAVAGKEKKLAHHYLTEWLAFMEKFPYGNLYDWVSIMEGGEGQKQPNISTEECKYFLELMGKKPYEGKRRVVVFWLPEFLGNESNRLLKTMEEPPEDTYLLFITHHPQSLLPTVKSRCLTLTIGLPTDEEMLAYMQGTYAQWPEERMRSLLSYAQGNLRTLYQYVEIGFDSEQSLEEDMIALFESITSGGPVRQVEWIQRMNERPRSYVEQWLKALRTHIVLLMQPSESPTAEVKDHYHHPALLEMLRYIRIGESAELCVEAIDQSIYALTRNAHPKLQLHDFILQLYQILKHQRIYFPHSV